MTKTTHALRKSKPAFLLDIPDHIIEKACATYWNTGLYPGQLKWADLVQQENHRVPDIRLAIHAALSVAMAEPLPLESTHHGWTYCAFCGAEYPQGTPRHGDGALTQHIMVCPEHPMRKVEQERDEALTKLKLMESTQ